VTKIRVGIDGRAFTSPAAGIRRYVSELAPALLSSDASLELVALGGSPQSIPADVRHVSELWHPPTNLGWAAIGLPSAARRAAVDLIHAPAYTAPLHTAVPTVLTIHDVSYERHPEWYPHRRDWLRRSFYRRSARAAAHILTVSDFSRREIAAAYGIADDRITVAPLGVKRGFGQAEAPAPIALPAGIVAPFLLHVGDLHERRNLPVVVRGLIEARRRLTGSHATAKLAEAGRDTPPLSLVTAGVDRGVGHRLSAFAAENGAPDALVHLGPVSEPALRALYRDAAALVYPSRYEGFGLPLVEAMASGIPVLASRAASIPEVVGESGILLDPDDPGQWADAIVDVMTDAVLRARLHTDGLARAALFSWERTARITLDVYRRVAAR
jgi:glycosyltransferase involved in cell wall biosynthesis